MKYSTFKCLAEELGPYTIRASGVQDLVVVSGIRRHASVSSL
jgi:hypothetical protein